MTRAFFFLIIAQANASSQGSCKVGGADCNNELHDADEVTLLQSEIKAHKKRRTHVDNIFRQFRTGDESDDGIALAQFARAAGSKRQVFSAGKESDSKPSMFIVAESDGTAGKVTIRKPENVDGSSRVADAEDIPSIYFSPNGKAVFFELAAGEGGNKCTHPVGVHAKLGTDVGELPEKVGGKQTTTVKTDSLSVQNSGGEVTIESEFTEPLKDGALLVPMDAPVKDVALEDFLDYVDGEKEIPTDFCREASVSLMQTKKRRTGSPAWAHTALDAAWGFFSWWR